MIIKIIKEKWGKTAIDYIRKCNISEKYTKIA